MFALRAKESSDDGAETPQPPPADEEEAMPPRLHYQICNCHMMWGGRLAMHTSNVNVTAVEAT